MRGTFPFPRTSEEQIALLACKAHGRPVDTMDGHRSIEGTMRRAVAVLALVMTACGGGAATGESSEPDGTSATTAPVGSITQGSSGSSNQSVTM